jgi:hypothetical protein
MGSMAYSGDDVLKVEQLMGEALYQISSYVVVDLEEEIPEVFDLRPLSRRLVKVTIGEIRPAQFHYVPSDDWDEEIDA